MTEASVAVENTADTEAALRIYEVGYHISPAVKEEDLEKVTGTIRSIIEKSGGSFIAEGAPALTKLAYEISTHEGGKRVDYDRGYFGWIKFESTVEVADQLGATLKSNALLLRSIVFRTVREDTRAKIKIGSMREVKRGDTIKAAPRREEVSAPVSEADLDKALSDLTLE